MTDSGWPFLFGSFGMSEFLRTPVAQAVIWVTFTLVLSLVARYGLSVWRDRANDEDTSSDHLTKFRELTQEGVLSEKEFRTIKTVLAPRMHEELTPEEGEG